MTELRLAFRQWLKHPGFAAAAVVTLALGIGANTAIFSVIHAVLIRPFPYPESERIMFLAAVSRERPRDSFPLSLPDLVDWQNQATGFEGLGGALDSQFVVTGHGEATRVKGAYVSPVTLALLRVGPRLGRPLLPADDTPGAARVCVLAHRAWERFFGSDPGVLGRSLVLNGVAHEVVGVMPPEFKFWDAWAYVPLHHGIPAELRNIRGIRMGMWGIGRLKPGVTPEQAEQEIDALARRAEAAFPSENRNTTGTVRPLAETVGGRIRTTLMLLFGAVGCVLLIACVNVTNLLLARGAARVRELAVRSALGASRGRLVRQLILETLPLGLVAALAGVFLAMGGLHALLSLIPAELLPAEATIGLSWPVLAFNAGVGLFTAMLAGAIPAWHGAQAAVGETLKDGGRSGTGLSGVRIRGGLVVAEVALALTLLAGAGLLIRSLLQTARTDPGFRAERLLVAAVELPEETYRDPERNLVFAGELLDRMRRFPQVTKAATVSAMPLFTGNFVLPFLREGQAYSRRDELRSAYYNAVTPEAFATLGLKMLRGRTFTEDDRAGGERVVILNAAAAQQFFGDEDPVGRRVASGLPGVFAPENPTGIMRLLLDPPWARVVGVVSDTRQNDLTVPPQPEAYYPLSQSFPASPVRNQFTLVLRTDSDPRTLAELVRREVRSMDPHLPMDRVRAMDTVIAESLRGQRFAVVLLGVFAGVATLLAALGIYSVVAWLVSQRTREMGIRMALGATPRAVVGLVVAQGVRPILLGLACGLALAFAVARIMASHVDQLTISDPRPYAWMSLGLALVALFACWLPARRAARVDPLGALRAE